MPLKYYQKSADLNNAYILIKKNKIIQMCKQNIYDEKLKLSINNLKDKFNKIKEENILLKSLPGEKNYYSAMKNFNLFTFFPK
jgi:hypothetical protein